MKQTYAELLNKLRLYSPPECFEPQDASDWQGPFPLPEELARFYQEVGLSDVELTGPANGYVFPSLANLWAYHQQFAEYVPLEDAVIFLSEGGEFHFLYRISDRRVYLYDLALEELVPLGLDFGTFIECVVETSTLVEEITYLEYDFDEHAPLLVERITRVLGREEEARRFLLLVGLIDG